MTLGLFFEGTGQGGAGESAAVCAAVSEAVERKSERMDTAYSPRLHELSATASRILLRVVELWLENIGCGMVESESLLDSTRRMVGAWLLEGWRRALHVRVRQVVEGRLWMGLRFPMVIGVGKRLRSGWKNGCG